MTTFLSLVLLAILLGGGGVQLYLPVIHQNPDFTPAFRDLAVRLNVASNEITLLDVVYQGFPDIALGMPEPGHAYPPAGIPGAILHLSARGQVCEYRMSCHPYLHRTMFVGCKKEGE